MTNHSAPSITAELAKTDPLWPMIEANPTLAALITFAVGLIIASAGARMGTVSTREILEDRDSWSTLIADYRSTGSDRYFKAVERVMGFATRVWGPRPISWRAFGRSYQLAILYPLIAILLSWALFDAGTLGGMTLFPLGDSLWLRIGKTLFILSSWAIAAYIFVNAENFSDFLVAKIFGSVDMGSPRASFLSKVARGLVGTLALFVAFAFAGAVAVAGAGAGAGAFAVAVAGAVTGAVAVAQEPEAATILLLFISVLPAVNACADVLSLAVTRHYLNKVVATRPAVWTVLLQLACDLCLAALCLIGLLYSTVGILTLWHWFAPESLAFSWQSYWQNMQTDWRSGTALYLMVATTLIPTFVHVIAGLGAVITQKSHQLTRVAITLEDKLRDGENLNTAELGKLLTRINRATMFGLFVATIVTLLGAFLLWHLGWFARGLFA